jgi:hypothetical protein
VRRADLGEWVRSHLVFCVGSVGGGRLGIKTLTRRDRVALVA